MEQRLPVRRGGDQGLALPAIDTVAEIAVVDPIAALHAHEQAWVRVWSSSIRLI